MKKGYSLIELVIVVGLVAILSVSISAIVLTTIVNSNRIKTKIRVRQTGDYAVGQIQTMIRNAKNITACNSTNDTVTLLNQDNGVTVLAKGGSDNDQIASNSALLTPEDIEVTGYDVTCSPSDTAPKLVNFLFTMGKADADNERAIEHPTQSFSISAEMRNE